MKYYISLFALLSWYSSSIAQCTNIGSGSNQGSLSFDADNATYQTIAVNNGYYFTFNAVCGNTYVFDFCTYGSLAGLWPEITILNNSNNSLAFSPYAGGCSTLSWTATSSQTVKVFITDSGCSASGSYSGTMAYNEEVNNVTPTFTFDLLDCDEVQVILDEGSAGGAYSFTTNPGGGTSINSSTGIITNADPGDTYSIDYDVCGTTTTFDYTFPTNLSDFEMTEVCGGGVPTINGVQGGTFTFSPDPADGSQISTSTGVVSNGVVGATYNVDYTVCGSTSSASILITDNNCFTMNGDAQQIVVNGESCIQLTDEVNNETGCAWNGSTIDFAQNFSLSLDYYFGDNIGGADGNTFTFQPSSSSACGQNGGQLGAGGISNSLSIEFDTYDNDNPSHIYDRLCDHIAIEVDGDHQNGPPAAGPECAKPDGGNIDDGGVYGVEIQWDATTQTLSVYFNGLFVLDYTDDVVTNVFGGVSEVYWGATSATGGLNNMQYFCPSTIVILPTELVAFDAECKNESTLINWKTVNERDLDMYVLEYTYDGHIYYPIHYVNPIGNEPDVINEYQVDLGNFDTSNKYFRIKIVNNNNSIEYSNFIAIKNCQDPDNSFFGNMKDETLVLQSLINEEFDFTLYNSLGQIVLDGSSLNGEVNLYQNLTKGIYFAYLTTQSGESESLKLINN